MKLATVKDGSRDGRLAVVSRDLMMAVDASPIAPTLQFALDHWDELASELEAEYERLNIGEIAGQPFDPRKAMAPLPRAYQWADGSAYVNHVELVRKARGAVIPDSFYEEPLMYQGGSDSLSGPFDPIVFPDEAVPGWGIDMEGEVAVITGDVPMGISAEEVDSEIRLVMLVNDVSLRGLIPSELEKGFGFFQSKPSSSFSPVAVTVDELEGQWDKAKLCGTLRVDLNEKPFGRADCGQDMTFSFAELIAHAAKTRSLSAGTIVGSGTVSNKGGDGSPGKPVSAGGRGYSCIAEQRMVETLENGQATTPFLTFGDRVSIEMISEDGSSIFGAIDQEVKRR